VLVVAWLILAIADTGEAGGFGMSPAEAAAFKDEAGDVKYIETRLATDWPDRKAWIDTANPSYKAHYRALARWWVETLDEEPWREIGFDAASNAIVAGPSDSAYGFWCDTNMTLHDFHAQDPDLREISETEFEVAWARFFDSSG
jgi:hypothetical protein